MFFRSTVWLGLSVFLFTLLGAGLPAEALLKNKTSTSREPTKDLAVAVIDGFRSAKFGMNEKQVLRAITKDFNFPKSKVGRLVTPKDKATALFIHLPKLLEFGGPADVVYLIEYNSKRLIQVNIDWGKGVTENYTAEDVINAANFLRNHFTKKKYKRKGIAVNSKLNDTTLIVFRGLDAKDRMILLRLKSFKAKKGEDKEAVKKHIQLKLSYKLKATQRKAK
jgi:hypothetical protein